MIEKSKIEKSLSDNTGCVRYAAEDLMIPVRTMYHWLRYYELNPDRFRPENRRRGKWIEKTCPKCGRQYSMAGLLAQEHRGSEQVGDIIVDFFLCSGNLPVEEIADPDARYNIIPCGAKLAVVRR
jgi:hypothetical protein